MAVKNVNKIIMNAIESKLAEIKKMIGLDLSLCDTWPGIYSINGKEYFNVKIDKPFFCSVEYDKLINLSKTYPSVLPHVETNGHMRLSIFIN